MTFPELFFYVLSHRLPGFYVGYELGGGGIFFVVAKAEAGLAVILAPIACLPPIKTVGFGALRMPYSDCWMKKAHYYCDNGFAKIHGSSIDIT